MVIDINQKSKEHQPVKHVTQPSNIGYIPYNITQDYDYNQSVRYFNVQHWVPKLNMERPCPPKLRYWTPSQ